jgi:transcriptional regulator with XRE-family HTH domain
MPKIPKTMNLPAVIQQKIRQYREEAGLTQKELGLKLGYKEENAQAQIYQYDQPDKYFIHSPPLSRKRS